MKIIIKKTQCFPEEPFLNLQFNTENTSSVSESLKCSMWFFFFFLCGQKGPPSGENTVVCVVFDFSFDVRFAWKWVREIINQHKIFNLWVITSYTKPEIVWCFKNISILIKRILKFGKKQKQFYTEVNVSLERDYPWQINQNGQQKKQ